MSRFYRCLAVVLFLTISISAQAEKSQPELVDKYNYTNLEEVYARVTGWAVRTGEIPGSKALVRISGGQEDFYDSAYKEGGLIKGIWESTLRAAPERLLIQFCNVNKEPLMTRFYIVRENDQVKACEENLTPPKETALFYQLYFFEPIFDLVALEDSYIDPVGSAQGHYSRFSQNALKKLLSDSPQSRIYLVGYPQTNFDTDENGKIISRRSNRPDKKTLAGKMLRAVKAHFLKNGFSASQIFMLNGGYVTGNSRRVEIWFVPAGGKIPKPKLEYIPKKQN